MWLILNGDYTSNLECLRDTAMRDDRIISSTTRPVGSSLWLLLSRILILKRFLTLRPRLARTDPADKRGTIATVVFKLRYREKLHYSQRLPLPRETNAHCATEPTKAKAGQYSTTHTVNMVGGDSGETVHQVHAICNGFVPQELTQVATSVH
jgi:hypothetical protein